MLPYHIRPDDREAAEELHQRRQDRDRARDLQVGPVQPLRRVAGTAGSPVASAPNAFTIRWPVNASAVTCERCSSSSWLRRRAPADALPEADERIDDNRRAGHAHEREPEVHVEHDRRIADEAQALADQVADRFRNRLLHLVDVVGDPRHQLRRWSVGEKKPAD